jgi:tetraacyldisaccharide-1-P 4'-kinase
VGNLVRYLAAHRSADVVALGNIAVGGRTLVVVVVAADLKKHPRLYI